MASADADEKRERKKRKKEDKKRRKKEEKRKKKKKRKRDSTDSSSSSSSGAVASALATVAAAATAQAAYRPAHEDFPMPRGRSIGSCRACISSASCASSPHEQAMRDVRSARFAPTASELAMRAAAPAAAPRPGTHVRGSSVALEKSYLRLTALPRADDVRPLPVLVDAFELVQRRWAAERDYHYTCEQLKAIRQDLTVQHLAAAAPRARFATQVYEAHARIALEVGERARTHTNRPPTPRSNCLLFFDQVGDYDEYSACQAQLIPLHAYGLASTAEARAEFCAYRLLYCVSRRPDAISEELGAIVGNLPRSVQAAPPLARALALATASAVGDFGAYFAELNAEPLGTCTAALLEQPTERMRLRALRATCKAFQPSVPIRRAAQLLGFGPDTRGAARWLGGVPGAMMARERGTGAPVLDTRTSAQLFGRQECGPPPPPG